MRTPGSWASSRFVELDHRGAEHVAGRRREVELRRCDEVGRVERAGAEGAHDLGELLGLARAGGAQPVGDRARRARRAALAELHLELAEARREPGAVEHRHLVVDDLRELLAVARRAARRGGARC